MTDTDLTVAVRRSQKYSYTSDQFAGPPPAKLEVGVSDPYVQMLARANQLSAGVELSAANTGVYRPDGYATVHETTLDLSACEATEVVLTFEVSALVDSTDTPGHFRQALADVGAEIEVQHAGGLSTVEGRARSVNEAYDHYTFGTGFFTDLVEAVPFTALVEVPITVNPQDPTASLKLRAGTLGLGLSHGIAIANAEVTLVDAAPVGTIPGPGCDLGLVKCP
ncbi:MAG TPA: hypothetical protein VK034_29115 [Enhygromyxa sp.]|nr:hypothetical protein [Enhygromyxa sp.]